MPVTPSVMTLPLATTGELRGPPCPESGPLTASAAYLAAQFSFPVAASRHRSTSSSPCLENTKSLSPTSAGVASPLPTSTFHFWASSLGHVLGASKPTTLPSRLAPRHCGQSWANRLAAQTVARLDTMILAENFIVTPGCLLSCFITQRQPERALPRPSNHATIG